MKKRVISVVIFLAYIAVLIKVMVFKDIPTIKVGQLMMNFAGADAGHGPNFIPFATIGPYLMGYKGWIIAGINLVGNIILLVPIGFLLPLLFPKIGWKKSLAIAVASGLIIETTQTLLRVGIFDIDDVILNALGVMIGYFAYMFLSKWMRERKYTHILMAAFICIALAAGGFSAIYPWGKPVNPGVRTGAGQNEQNVVPSTKDLCGGTGGNGQIEAVGSHQFTMKRNDGVTQIVTLTKKATITIPAGSGSESDLKIGDRVTLVGGPNPDGSFTAEAIFICG